MVLDKLLFSPSSDVIQSWIMFLIGVFWFCVQVVVSMDKCCEIDEHCVNFNHWMTSPGLPQSVYCSNNWNTRFLISNLIFPVCKTIIHLFHKKARPLLSQELDRAAALVQIWCASQLVRPLLFIGKIPKMAPAGQNRALSMKKCLLMASLLWILSWSRGSISTFAQCCLPSLCTVSLTPGKCSLRNEILQENVQLVFPTQLSQSSWRVQVWEIKLRTFAEGSAAAAGLS